MAPVFAGHIPFLKRWTTPVDMGRMYRHKRIFGNNKTWRGIIFGTIIGGVTAIIISSFYKDNTALIGPFWVGCVLGFGALGGDALESFVKRQLSIKPGQSWFPFDQLDFIIGGLVSAAIFANLTLKINLLIIVIYFGLHVLTNYFGFLVGIRKRPI